MKVSSLMYRFAVLAVLFISMFIPLSASADKTTGLVSSSAVYSAGTNGGIYGVDIIHDGTNSCTVTIYSGNGAVASNATWRGVCYAADSSTCSKSFVRPRPFKGGFYVVMSGTGCYYIVHYDINI